MERLGFHEKFAERSTNQTKAVHIYPVDINYYPRICVTDVMYTDGYWVCCNGCQQNVIKYYTFILFVTYTVCLFPYRNVALFFLCVLRLSSKFKPQKQQNFCRYVQVPTFYVYPQKFCVSYHGIFFSWFMQVSNHLAML